MDRRSKWSLIGIPDHQAVLNVGGRVGAARGPRAFRLLFSRMKGRSPVLSTCTDAGDAVITQSIETNHEAAAALIARTHAGLSVVVGGSHDHGYSHLLGIARAT